MTTTTVRLSLELKARVASAAEREGTTAHNFILTAIEEKAAQAERRSEFHAQADQRFQDMLTTGRSIPWAAMREYLQARVAGTRARRPAAKKLAR